MSDDWRKDAACLGCDPDLFFPHRDDVVNISAAKRVCAICPVKAECLEEHLWETVGVFGGTSAKERRALRRGLPRPVALIEHGTRNGYAMELRRGLEPCPACRLAHVLYHAELVKYRRRLAREAS